MRISTEVEICNSALFRVKAPRIISLEDDSLSAEGCRLFYHQSRESLLSEYAWDFAIRSEPLRLFRSRARERNAAGVYTETEADWQNRISTADYFLCGYTYKYALPAGMLRLYRVYHGSDLALVMQGSPTPRPPYRKEGGYLLTDLSNISVRFVCDEERVVLFSPLFKDLLVLDLAKRLCLFFEDNGQRFMLNDADKEKYLIKAKAMDSQQAMSDFYMPDPLDLARYF